jgi:large subunit ribosomal protein L3
MRADLPFALKRTADSDPLSLSSSGAVSGPKGCLVMIQDALKKPWPNIPPPPKPTEADEEQRAAPGAE